MNAEEAVTIGDDAEVASAAWLVRAGQDPVSTILHNLENGVVTVGWGDWIAERDPAAFSDRESMEQYVAQRVSDTRIGRGCGEIWLFCNEIKIGDSVVMPLKRLMSRERQIAIGLVIGRAVTDASQPEFARLRRAVQWLAKNTPEAALQADLLNSVKWPQQTVLRLDRPNAARRILHLAQQGEDPGAEGPHLSGAEAGALGRDGAVIEGAARRVAVNKYERDSAARSQCIAVHGTDCAVCGVDFGVVYGDFARGYIHVHHKTPVAEAAKRGEYELDPLRDLVPVCPNCHAMLHHHPDKPCSVEKLRTLMRR